MGHDDRVTDLETELANVASRESAVRAWTVRLGVDETRAAHASSPAGPLHGWTLGVKDVIDTADFPTERGSAVYRGRRPGADAACVALARAAGAVVVGKTATTEFALFTPAVTTNPHDPGRTPGGSSSGSAAAVASGMVRAAFGTQTVGSVLRPAAFCGVVGFKGTFGLVPLAGVAPLAHSLDTLGWHTVDVADAAAMFAALTGAQASPAPHRPPRLGLYRSHQWDRAQPELGPLFLDLAERLAAAGAEMLDLEPAPHLTAVADAGETILGYEASRIFAWERATHADRVHPQVLRLFERGDRIGTDRYRAAQRTMTDARHAHSRYLAEHQLDALITPSAPGEAPGIETTGDSVFNRVWSTLGTPALQLPVGRRPHGLPLGVQLTADRWDDDRLLGVATWVEAALADSNDPGSDAP